jgi:hypothetical protein
MLSKDHRFPQICIHYLYPYPYEEDVTAQILNEY